MTFSRNLLALGGLCLLAAAGCSRDMTSAAASSRKGPQVPVTVRLAAAVVPQAGTPASPLADGGWGGGGEDHNQDELGRVHRADIDSLIVTVTKVEVRVPLADAEDPADEAAETHSDNAKAGDDDDDHEQDEVGWDTLDVTGGGHLDLIHLPTDAASGLTVASGTLAPGTYRHVRVFVTSPMIFLNTPITTPTGDVLNKDVGYPVIIPSADATGAAVKTDESFTVPTGGGSVPLFFDADDTIRHVRVTGDGKIIIPPVIR
jgi:hypothetical protein